MIAMICAISFMSSSLICDPEQISDYKTQAAIELALPLIKRWEGTKLCAYRDPRPRGKIWTIGTGHTGPDVHRGICITEEHADDLLRLDMAAAAHEVAQLVRVPLSIHERAALISFVFNLGSAKVARGNVPLFVNAGKRQAAMREMLRYCHAAGVRLEGLAKRRAAEVRLFATPDEVGR